MHTHDSRESAQGSAATFSWGALLVGLATGALLLTIQGCGGGGGGGGTPDGDGGLFGLQTRVPVTGLAFPDTTPNPTAVSLVNAYPSVSFNERPIYATVSGDGSRRVYVVEQGGRIHTLPDDAAATSASLFIDLSASILGPFNGGSNEEGLLGLCFDPNYATNGYFYVNYTASSPRRTVIARYTATFVQGQPPTANTNTQLIILEVTQPYSNHNAGMIEFGPDGYLYIALGDGGLGNDPDANGQDRATLLSSMLRIDVAGATQAVPYTVPADNPYVGHPTYRPEAWAYGLRNPWRFSFDRNNGELWLGDVGQGAREEISTVERGDNLGWPIYEGHRSNLNPDNLPASMFKAPVYDYGRTLGQVAVGGYVYRGQAVPTLAGAYVFGDYGSGRIFALVRDQAGSVATTEIAFLSQLTSFGEDADGELLAVSRNGTVHRFQEPAGTPPPAFPGTLTETGLFQEVATLTPAPGVIEYDLNAPLWSDDAIKRRWIALPGISTIGFSELGSWSFPVGTVLVKHFELPLGPGQGIRRLETRVLIHGRTGWSGYTYRWRDDQSEADLLPGGTTDTFTIQDPDAPGGTREQTWTYPSRTDCLQCHTQAAGFVLGVHTRQLQRAFAYPTFVDQQLRAWNHIGLFGQDLGDTNRFPAFADPAAPTAPLDDRARAYLDSNCSNCHRPGGPAPGNLDLRAEVAPSAMGILDVIPQHGDLGVSGSRLVDPGDAANSTLWLRMGTLDSSRRMPRLGSSERDSLGIALLEQWINALR